MVQGVSPTQTHFTIVKTAPTSLHNIGKALQYLLEDNRSLFSLVVTPGDRVSTGVVICFNLNLV